MAYQSIPLDAVHDQEVYVTVGAGGNSIPLSLRVRWNEQGGFFVMAVSEGSGRELLAGIPLVAGLSPAENLLAAYEYLGIGEAILLPERPGLLNKTPDIDSIGREFQLVWGDDS